MNKEQQKRLTLADVVAKKQAREKDAKKTQELNIGSYDMYILVKKLDDELFSYLNEKYKDDEMGMINRIVYECVVDPKLKDEKTQETLGITCEPSQIINETVKAVFPSVKERGGIATEILNLSDLAKGGVSVVQHIKN
ncbi:hypothetical protein [Clostridium saccharobutylicum]|uniref:Phage XkdN-like protein n=1 Tax=Clostridium saccharobutylicum DSM 13864 TaxID=1345695 RepID=U5MWZ5_CLOSA|nr:hypothetical protein [Clostridium saccharobutylicum]AGX43952.1 hypothetical protein CLSA_c29850 [Clostridium saccharobutylicum DSM 13864]AQR91249.1 hypothetical protein CLOSC_29730 [Clostridium saccharobutylicum]AQS01153.1 hypothetical protein CSACC_29800 [Clostridium saccharobutylicum]AQS10566.1 hypothetical protein CLOBY_27110 [Clostridium saccharobutylicum]AQS15136.1 hypothetical protein CLOSACC_29800 [Clostridium saccharobutylicum]